MARPARLSSTDWTSGERTERRPSRLNSFVSIYTKGKTADRHNSLRRLIGKPAAPLQSTLVFEIACEIGRVVRGLKSDEMVGAQLRNQPFVVGRRGESFR